MGGEQQTSSFGNKIIGLTTVTLQQRCDSNIIPQDIFVRVNTTVSFHFLARINHFVPVLYIFDIPHQACKTFEDNVYQISRVSWEAPYSSDFRVLPRSVSP